MIRVNIFKISYSLYALNRTAYIIRILQYTLLPKIFKEYFMNQHV